MREQNPANRAFLVARWSGHCPSGLGVALTFRHTSPRFRGIQASSSWSGDTRVREHLKARVPAAPERPSLQERLRAGTTRRHLGMI